MKIYDISMEISEEMQVYKNKADKKPKITAVRTLKDGANESKLDIFVHTGSHVDAPYHIFDGGKKIDGMDLGRFMGKAVVLDFTKAKNKIDKKILLKKNFFAEDIVLLKTKILPDKVFNPDFTYLDESGAKFLASKKIKAVGIDSLGIERSQPNHETHKILLGKNIPIFEGLDLSKVKPGKYFFYGLPLKIRNGDASPVRAVLVRK